ncbi:MAG: NADH-quinone oxidoreductase subunit G [Alphaproteobacteria bacterium CG11_big_fil_rev_8_21_14_0_20_44_7]|nr:MAG: NADH-quinone oxidoreductase subunit G [Alphaproteobacteria bacterium CG11_big_fil_rev_8_21_14_0_20_44_7]
MPKVTIDGKELEVEPGTLIIQAAEQLDIEIPRFCYHERLAVAGNCRMCLVEVEGGPPKPVASCAMPVNEGMKVHTNSPMVKKAREGVMEFLLINHPLDCPICDQGGECDLQDQSLYFGSGASRYDENKRAVPEKYMGPLIKTHMTRCIHCTRCIRFCDDVAGVSEMGALNRGEHTEITTYLQKSLTSELSANVIDLCPVGALTSRPYAFHARPWELKKTESIDVTDAVGSNIRIDTRGREVMRILPRNHDEVNEEWISDKARYACDGLRVQRLDKPYMRIDGKLTPVSWEQALTAAGENLARVNPEQIGVVAGDQVDAETMFAMKQLCDSLKIRNIDCRQDGAQIDATNRASYLFNTHISGIEQADALLIIGADLRKEAPIVNARIRKSWLHNRMKIANIGDALDFTYDCAQLGNDVSIIEQIVSGKHEFAKILKNAERPMLILGSGVLTHKDSLTIQQSAQKLAEKYGLIANGWDGYNVIHTAASRVAGLDLGFVPPDNASGVKEIEAGKLSVVYLLAADEIDTSKLKNKFVIYQGHHGDAGAEVADIILPGAAYTEKDGIYLNIEGRVQHTNKALLAPGDAREDWKIIRALSEFAGKKLKYNSLEELRAELFKKHPHFANFDKIAPVEWQKTKSSSKKLSKSQLQYPISNFYMTCPLSRNSKTMAECSAMHDVNGKEVA